VDPHHTRRGRGHPLESQAAEESLLLAPTWTADELGKRTSIERFFGRVFSLFSCFRLPRPPFAGWSAIATQVVLTYAATVVVGLAAHQVGRPTSSARPNACSLPLGRAGTQSQMSEVQSPPG
jgi:hypothetical protein